MLSAFFFKKKKIGQLAKLFELELMSKNCLKQLKAFECILV